MSQAWDVIIRPNVREHMAQDFRLIANLSDDRVIALKSALETIEGFLDGKKLVTTIKSEVDDDDTVIALEQALVTVSAIGADTFIAAFEEQVAAGRFPLDSDVFSRFAEVLRALVQPYPALLRYQKAERLAALTGDHLEAVSLICDLRPIFDSERTAIEGMMPYTRLHIVSRNKDGTPGVFEVELERAQVEHLAKIAEMASTKLEVLYDAVTAWMPGSIPDLSLTARTQDANNEH